MLCIQVSIGALNDAADAPLDAWQQPRKPIPSGLASRRGALAIAAVGSAAGLALSAASGPATLAVATAGLGLGFAYDLRASHTAWSWLPLSLALPLLPIHAWLGAVGLVPPGLLTLSVAGVLAGAALALANGLVDLERDAGVGRGAVVVRLGARRAWLANVGLLATVLLMAIFLAPAVIGGTIGDGQAGTPQAGLALGPDVLRLLRGGGVVVGVVAVSIGAVALAARSVSLRERGWELQAAGVAAMGLGWLAGTAGNGGGG
jgi:4-hydroxybenzoate polyprenyltransferase